MIEKVQNPSSLCSTTPDDLNTKTKKSLLVPTRQFHSRTTRLSTNYTPTRRDSEVRARICPRDCASSGTIAKTCHVFYNVTPTIVDF